MEYIAAEFAEMGLSPGGDEGTFFQTVPLVGVKAELPKVVTAHARAHANGGGTVALRIPRTWW